MKSFVRIDYRPCYAISDDNGFIGILPHLPIRKELLMVSRIIGIPLERVRVKFLGCKCFPTYINLPF